MADPGENIWSWSTTATDNAGADALINWAEGMPRASVNNSARSEMAAHAKDRNLRSGVIVTAGTANAQTFSSGHFPLFTTVPTGFRTLLKIGPGLTNTTSSPTLSMDGIAAAVVKDNLGSNAGAGAMREGSYVEFRFDGTNWIIISGGGGFGTGTLMLFQQETAPVGWTKQTTHNDKALRVVSGALANGGTVAFSTVFGRTTTDGHQLTLAELANHIHGIGVVASAQNEGQSIIYTGSQFGITGAPSNLCFGDNTIARGAGGNTAHSHTMDMRVQYVDIIIASKD